MRNEIKVLLGTIALGPVLFWGPRVLEDVAGLDVFRISRVDVSGAYYVTSDAVIEQLGLGPLASVWGDRDAWAERVAEHPLILEAEVRRRLPNRLRVTVRERRPVAFAATPTLEALDAEGVRLPIDPTRTALDLPVIAAGEMPPADAAVFPAEVRRLASELEYLTGIDEDFVTRISTVRYAADGALKMELLQPEVDFLMPSRTPIDRLREGRAALQHAIAFDPGHPPSVVDLRFAGQVVVRRAK
jgi:cell division septal protein FtsQ